MHSREVRMRRLLCLVLVLFAVPAFAQYPEVDAAVDAFMAKDLAALGKHLPPGLQKGLADLPAIEKQQLAGELLPAQHFLKEDAIVQRSDSPDALVTIRPRDPEKSRMPTIIITLDKRISDGAECLLQFNVKTTERQVDEFQAWMKFVDSEWRIYELQAPGQRQRVKFDAPDFLAKMRHTDINSNESSAVSSMRAYNTAAVTYASTYPDIGFPQTAEDMKPPTGDQIDEHHAGLLDNTLTTPPFQKNGYRFAFKGDKENYKVIARPIKLGVSGNRSFYSDESGVIRYTDKDEEPTVDDPPLQ
jgi:hypothetical protein